jgi:sister-chromatid-cohesion protein PDS5
MLQLKLLDPDEKVRAAVCKVYSQLDYETALHSVSEDQLRAVAGRGMDKKHAVRVEAMNALGKLYSLACPEMYVPFSRECYHLMHSIQRER